MILQQKEDCNAREEEEKGPFFELELAGASEGARERGFGLRAPCKRSSSFFGPKKPWRDNPVARGFKGMKIFATVNFALPRLFFSEEGMQR